MVRVSLAHPRFHRLVAGFLTAIATFAVIGTFPVAAQDRPVPTAAMLKRIAEAVESSRNRDTVYVVMNRDSVTVVGMEDKYADAERVLRALARAGLRYDIWGPYLPTNHWDWLIDIVPDGCVHDGQSNMIGLICDGGATRYSQIRDMSLTLRMRDGTARTIALPAGTDALFLTYSALDKFVFPYYERVIGLGATFAMRQRYMSRPRR